MENKIMIAIGIILVPLFVFLLYTLFILMPVSMWAEAKCLRNGYPKTAVTINLEAYCMNLNGSVTVRVEKTDKVAK